jgi:hypothetical protein
MNSNLKLSSDDTGRDGGFSASRLLLMRCGIILVRTHPDEGLDGYFASGISGWKYLPTLAHVGELIQAQQAFHSSATKPVSNTKHSLAR